MALTPVDEALALILADAKPLSSEQLDASQALGRVLAERVTSAIAVPGFDNSAMDGYALRHSDIAVGRLLRISQRIPAGANPEVLEPGTAARIFTGAPMPPGADTVVMQEDTELVDKDLRLLIEPVRGQHVRGAGEDIAIGKEVLAAGTRLDAAGLGLLAAVGRAEISVCRRPRVALISTGDELRQPGESLRPGQIYNSNRPMLAALLAGLGCELIDCGVVADDAKKTAQALAKAADQADLIISTGGVSVGEEDHVKAQVERLGQLRLWKLAIKPGKPLAYGRLGDTVFFGLPGNPSSSFVTFLIVVAPYLRLMQGRSPHTPVWSLPADFAWSKPGTRQEYLRSRIRATASGPVVEIFPHQGSGVLSSAAWADSLTIIPIGETVQPGDPVSVHLLNELCH